MDPVGLAGNLVTTIENNNTEQNLGLGLRFLAAEGPQSVMSLGKMTYGLGRGGLNLSTTVYRNVATYGVTGSALKTASFVGEGYMGIGRGLEASDILINNEIAFQSVMNASRAGLISDGLATVTTPMGNFSVMVADTAAPGASYASTAVNSLGGVGGTSALGYNASVALLEYVPNRAVADELAAIRRIGANQRNRVANASELRQAYSLARNQIDFAHIEYDVKLFPNGGYKAMGGHFSTSPKLQIVPGTKTVYPNKVIEAQVKMQGPDGNWYLKNNNYGQWAGYSTLTPENWSLPRAKGEMSRAWLNRYEQGGKWFGESSGVQFRFNPPPLDHPTIDKWRGFPVKLQPSL